ncbi:MAG: glycosyl hydrolase [Candidatus Binatia bacterium]
MSCGPRFRAAGVALALVIVVALAAAGGRADAAELDVAPITVRTFANPPRSVRPLYRWWMPLAYTDDDELRAELIDMAAAGAGGVEVVGFVVPGAGNQGNAFLADYGWGTPRWAHKMEVVTEAAAALRLRVDLNLGPHYPPTVPTLYGFNQREAEQQLVFGRELDQPGTTRGGALPAPLPGPPSVTTKLCLPATAEDGSLRVESVGGFAPGDVITVGVGATAERVTVRRIGDRTAGCTDLAVSPIAKAHASAETVVNVARTTRVRTVIAQCAADCSATSAAPILLVPSSVVDVTDRVRDGALEHAFPVGNGRPWVVIDFLQTASGLIAQRGGFTETQPNYVVDHLSEGGVRIQTDFWGASVLTGAVRANVARIGGGAIFEDSLELGSTQKWTWSFLDEFARRRGYDPTTLLPALAGIGAQGIATPAFELEGIGPQVREDYRRTLGELYVERYVAPMQRWAGSHGMEFRVQPYGMPIAAGVASAAAGIAEGESLGFAALGATGAEQAYRVLAAGARVNGHDVVSTECCAAFFGNYRSSVAGPSVDGNIGAGGDGSQLGGRYSQGLLDSVYAAYAGGVNQLVWHGYPYRDAPVGEGNGGRDGSWPGYHPWDIFGVLNVNDEFGRRQPAWRDFRRVNDALARMQLVLRQGTSVVDLAVFRDTVGLADASSTVTPQHFLGNESAVAAAGYTYDYVPPAFLADGGARVEADGSLSVGAMRRKALLLNEQSTIAVADAERLLVLARRGLRIFVIGDAPTTAAGAAPSGDRLRRAVDALLAERTVRRVAAEKDMPAALAADDIRPTVVPSASAASLGLVRRRLDGVSYDFVHNRSGAAVEQVLTLTGRGRPYRLDPWTGRIVALAQYASDDGAVTVPVRIPPYGQLMIALVDESAGPGAARHVHAVSSSGEVVADPSRAPVVRAVRDGRVTTTFDDGSIHAVDVSDVPPEQVLDSWTLHAQTWTPGDVQFSSVKTNQPAVAIVAGADGRLPSWREIRAPVDLERSSGIGTYTTSFELPSSWQRTDGAYLSLGDVLDTATVTVNGHVIALDPSDRGRIDLGSTLRRGRNTIRVRVATTLFNAVRDSGDDNYQRPDWQRTGLMGPVVLTPYRNVALPGTSRARLPEVFRAP